MSDGQYVMGTVLELTIATADPEAAHAAIREAVEIARELDGLLSRHRPDSAVSRLRAGAGGAPVAVDVRTTAVLVESIEYGRLTGGAFDVTVEPLVELWIAAAERDRLPDEASIAKASALVGADRIELLPGRARLPESGMSIDLGGIAKGQALDRMIVSLRDAGFSDALLSFGQSSIWALGAPPDHAGWRLLLRGPEDGYQGVVTLSDQAFSVSSTLGQWSEIGGQRFGHVIDPRTGWALQRGGQAAVVAGKASRAEVLSTALVILGAVEGMALVEGLADTEAQLIDDAGRVFESTGWRSATRYQELDTAPGDKARSAETE